MKIELSVAVMVLALGACATSNNLAGSAAPARHGTLSDLSLVEEEQPALCEHKVPAKVCVRCHPELAARFKAVNDWCPEHDIPESQCLECHPDLTFTPMPKLPEGADLRQLSTAGEDVAELSAHAAAGKVTVFDFYAEWCAPCRQVDRHVYGLLARRGDLAYRKLNMVSWESPLTRHYLGSVPKLPYVVVYGRDGKRVGEVVGFDLPALDALLERASR